MRGSHFHLGPEREKRKTLHEGARQESLAADQGSAPPTSTAKGANILTSSALIPRKSMIPSLPERFVREFPNPSRK